MPSLHIRRLVLAALDAGPGSACAQATTPPIAGAADLQFALTEIAAHSRAETGPDGRLSFGSSGNITRPIEQGSPVELFPSADEAFVFRLAEGLLAASVLVNLPFAEQPVKNAFAAIPPRLREAGAVSGMLPRKVLLRIALPLAWPGIATAAVLTFAHTLDEFGVVLMVGGSIPGETQTIAIAIHGRRPGLRRSWRGEHVRSAARRGRPGAWADRHPVAPPRPPHGAAAPIPLDLEVEVVPGELLVHVGPSGAGKFTVLCCIAGLHKAEHGAVRCAGAPWFDGAGRRHLPPHAPVAGLVFQDYALFPHMTAAKIVAAAMGHRPRAKRAARARALPSRVRLAGLEHRRPAELSGGQQQRVAAARALARDPAVLLLDERFSAVDCATRGRLQAELAGLRHDLAIPSLLVTHDLDEALALADRPAGRTAGPPRECRGRPAARLAQPVPWQGGRARRRGRHHLAAVGRSGA